MALNYDALTALTQKKHVPKMVDNIFKSNPLLVKMRERQQTYDGGYKIVEPLIYGEMSGITSYSLYDTVTYDTGIPVSAAEFVPKNVVAPIIISKDEELQNTGESQVLSMLEAKVQIAEETLKKKLTAMLYADGTGNGGKDITGLAAAVADTGTYGGIDRGTNAWWKSKISANGGTPRALSIDLMMSVFLAISDGSDQPDIMVAGPATWYEYHKLVYAKVQIKTEAVSKMASLGFQTLEFMGKPFVVDPNCPEGFIYFLNSKYFKWRPHAQANFATTKFRPDDSRIAKKQEILVTGNLTLNNSRRFGLLKDITYTAL